MICGDVTLNLNENLFLKNTTKSGTSSDVDTSGGATFDSSVDKRSQKKKLSVLSMKNHILAFPEKVCWLQCEIFFCISNVHDISFISLCHLIVFLINS